MYIRRIKLENIRSIRLAELSFDENQEAGWHVLIGENGTGKTSILRSIALSLIGPDEFLRLDPNWDSWLREGAEEATLEIDIVKGEGDKRSGKGGSKGGIDAHPKLIGNMHLAINDRTEALKLFDDSKKGDKYSPHKYFWGTGAGWFSCGFGPFRRFSGGNTALEHHYLRNPKIGAHLTIFQDDAALSESIVWLKNIQMKSLEEKGKLDWKQVVADVIELVNSPGFLPSGYQMTEINSDGVFFSTPDAESIILYQLSEGVKSVLGLAFELVRQILRLYQGTIRLIERDDENLVTFNAEGVVLIDEIDAHLHPEWQTRIGQWFTKHFPKIQFIVTTHSPLICRAAEKSIIWSLARSEEGVTVSEVKGETKDRLVYGNILDAVDTGLFGESADRSEIAVMMLEEMARLETRELFGKMSRQDKKRLAELKTKHLL